MREAIGNSFVLNFIITFLFLFMLIFVATLSYTKAFKVKNRIIDTIENYDGNIANNGTLNTNFKDELDTKLSEMGYRISRKNDCNDAKSNRITSNENYNNKVTTLNTQSSYRYCIYESDTERGKYYTVVAYIYFEVPLIGAKLEFPIYGETRIFMNL